MVELLSCGEIADRLHVAPATVLKWARQGIIPTIRIHRTLRFDPAEVETALRALAAKERANA